MTPHQILRAALKKVSAPGAWGQGVRGRDRPIGTCCIAEAVEDVSAGYYDERTDAFRAVYQAAGLDRTWGAISEWNDAPERTKSEVVNTLKLALNFVP